MSIRSFVAIPLPDSTANALGDATAKLVYQDKSNALRRVDQGNFHITLAFLGEQDEATLSELAERLDEKITLPSFDLSISQISPFPQSRPKLIAALIDKNAELEQLYQDVVAAVSACSIKLERKRFYPHITLARFRHSKNHFAGAINTHMDLSFEAEDVVLYESILTPNGAEYEPIFRFPLEFYDVDEFLHEV